MSSPQTHTYTTAILFATFSLFISLLIFPPMLWHLRNRNIGATCLIGWILALNLQSFINAIIWSNDDTSTWFNGNILCDIEVKIQIASAVGFVSSTACVLKALARVLDTDRTSLGLTKAQRRRGYAVDLLWCFGFPTLQMSFHYIVQTRRYYIWGFSGCTPSQDDSWLADLLVLAPPMIWTIICVYYALLIILRLHRYRTNFSSILASHNTSKSRFLRLFILCTLWVLASIPLQAYVLSFQVTVPHQPYSWYKTHDPTKWREVIMVLSGGRLLQSRYIWLCMGVLVFIFFGFGKDAMKMYKQGFRAIGLAACFPALAEDSAASRSGSITGTLSSVSSKAKLFFARKGSAVAEVTKSWSTDSRSSKLTSSSLTNTDTDPMSPKTATFLATVHENPNTAPPPASTNVARLSSFAWKRMTSLLKSPRSTTTDEEIALEGYMNETNTTISAPPRRATSAAALEKGAQNDIMVKREVRLGSETVNMNG